MNASGLWVRAAVLTAVTSLAALATGCPPPPLDCDAGECPGDVLEEDAVETPDAIDVQDAADAQDAMDAADVGDAPDAADARDAQDVHDAADVPTDSPARPSCDPIDSLGAAEVVVRGSVRGPSMLDYNRCAEATPGGEAVYRFEVPGSAPLGVLFSTAGSTLGASAASPSAIDTTLALYRGCVTPPMSTQELACNDNAGSSTGSVVRAVLDRGTYSVAVDTVGALASSGDFALYARTFTPVANARCAADAPLLAPGVAQTANVGRGGPYASPPCRRRDGGATVFYRMNVAAGMNARVTVTPTTAGWQPLVRVVSTCDADALCFADGVAAPASAGSPSAPLEVTVPTSVGRPMALWVAVSARAEPVADDAAAMVRLDINP